MPFCVVCQKTPSGIDELMGLYFAAKDTRPLSIMNTDHRLLASAYRLVIEPIANDFVSDAQKGFLYGRSLSQNIVNVGFESMKVSLTQSGGAIVLFDLAAVFSQPFTRMYVDGFGIHRGACENMISLPRVVCQQLLALEAERANLQRLRRH